MGCNETAFGYFDGFRPPLVSQQEQQGEVGNYNRFPTKWQLPSNLGERTAQPRRPGGPTACNRCGSRGVVAFDDAGTRQVREAELIKELQRIVAERLPGGAVSTSTLDPARIGLVQGAAGPSR